MNGLFILFNLLILSASLFAADAPGSRGVHGIADHATARRQGMKVLSRLPDGRAIVFASPESPVEVPSAERKISPRLGRALLDAAIVVFYQDVPPSDAQHLLADVGVRNVENPDLVPSQYLIYGTGDQITELAGQDQVAHIFPASPDLVRGRPVHSCAGAVLDALPISQYVATVGMGWDGFGQNSAALTYSYGKKTSQLPDDIVEEALARAIHQWERYADIKIERTDKVDAERNINVSFFQREHADGYPFDGKGRVLGHTFYPISAEPIAGDLHVDDDETWSDPEKLFAVFLHELGHALGLGHSDRPGAVMYPYFTQFSELQEEDIQALQRLYAPLPTVAETPADPPSADAKVEPGQIVVLENRGVLNGPKRK